MSEKSTCALINSLIKELAGLFVSPAFDARKSRLISSLSRCRLIRIGSYNSSVIATAKQMARCSRKTGSGKFIAPE